MRIADNKIVHALSASKRKMSGYCKQSLNITRFFKFFDYYFTVCVFVKIL